MSTTINGNGDIATLSAASMAAAVYQPAGTGAAASTVQAKLRQVSVSITDYTGADASGATSSSAALQSANDYLAGVGGGQIEIPSGTFLLSSSVALDSNVSIVGKGPTSILKGGVSGFITAVSKSNIEFRNVKFLNDNYRAFFDLCTNVRLIDCYGDGTRASTNVTNQGFWFSGCDDVLVNNPYFVDYRDAVYCDKSSATPCGTVTVSGGQIWQSKHGSLINYPTGVYGVDVKKLYVDGTIFKNIKASSDSVAGGTGYGVYEGDGTDGNLEIVKVTNCKFIDDDGYTTRPMIGVLNTIAKVGMVDTCYFKGPAGGSYVGFIYGSREQTIQNCVFENAACQPDRSTGTAKSWLIANNMFKGVTGRVLRVAPNSPGPQTVTISGNTFRDCTYGPVTVIYADYVHAVGNTIVECNTSGQTSDSYRGGINLDGPQNGLAADNLIINGTSGLMQYGINAAGLYNVYTSGNRYVGMTVSEVRNVINGDYGQGTFTPTIIGSSTAGTASYTSQIGKYTKNGRLITCSIRLNWSAGTGTGSLKIGGLPFTAANDGHYGAGAYGWIGDVALTASNVATAYVDPAATTATIYQYPVGGGAITTVTYDAAGNIDVTLIYTI